MTFPAFGRPHAWLLVSLALTLLLRVPSLLEPPWYDDEGIYAAVAHAMSQGAALYRDVADNRPPGMYLIYALFLGMSDASVFAVKLGAAAAVLATQVTVFFIAWRQWNARTALVTALLFGLLSSLPVLEGNLANAEVFMAFPIALAMLFALHGRFFSAGLALGGAFLIKQIAGVELAALITGLLLFAPDLRRSILRVAAGFLVPTALTGLGLLATGLLGDFLFTGFGYYLGYVQRETRIPATTIVMKLALLLATVAVVWWFARGHRSREQFQRTLMPVWLAFGVFGALFTSRPYPHYLLEALPPFLLVVVPAFVAQWHAPLPHLTVGRMVSVGALAVVTCTLTLSIYVPWVRWAAPDRMALYYDNFLKFATGERSLQAYNDTFDLRVNRNVVLQRQIEALTEPGDPVLIWGEEPWLYELADLMPVAPFVVSYYAYEVPQGLHQVVTRLRQERPRVVLWTQNKAMFPELRAELDRDYTVVSSVGNALLYQRLPGRNDLAANLPPGQSGGSQGVTR